MAVEVWMRNPHFCIRECVEAGIERIAWDRGFLVKYSIDPARFMTLHYGVAGKWRNILIGSQGATEITSAEPSKPAGVYPVWEYGDNLAHLEFALENPLGQDHEACSDQSVPIGLRPVLGQDHRVYITEIPRLSLNTSKQFLRTLATYQQDYPDCTIHLHGLYSFQYMFGLGFKSVDVDPRTTAKKGKVILPNGKEVTYERALDFAQWVTMLGFRPPDLKIPRQRCMFNMKSALWAGQHYQDEIKFLAKGSRSHKPDTESPLADTPTGRRIMSTNVKAEPGDKFVCDLCSLQTTCKYFRTGSVCVVPESEPQELAHYFGSRDADTIIDGLGTLLQAQTRRLQRAMDMEEMADGISPETTKIINSLFDRGVKLAKLLDPSLRANPTVNFKFQQNNATIQAATPQQLMAAVVAELEGRGVPRSAITPDMVQRILEQPEDVRAKAIEAAVVEKAG